jgi:hypothetical protein
MRKLIVMTMTFTLLIISSVPMSLAAAACAVPVHNTSSAEMAADMHSEHDQHAEHEHSMALNNDWQHDRIECGCGCHNSIDSLPQLLAPHMTSDAIHMTEQLTVAVANQPGLAWQVATVRVPLPPPQYPLIKN